MGNSITVAEDITDKVVIITGGNTGLGYANAVDLAIRKAHVIIACRSEQRGQEALKKAKQESGSEKIYLELLDLADLASIRDFVNRFIAKWDHLHILINNAGMGNGTRELTKDGFERTFGVNHLGHFLLTNLLLDLLKRSAPSRIVNVSSFMHKQAANINWNDIMYENDYSFENSYRQSKLANVLFTVELAKRLHGSGVTAVSINPGIVKTHFLTDISGLKPILMRLGTGMIGKSVKNGAKTQIHCAVDRNIPNQNGAYFSDSKVEELQDQAKNPEDALRLWELSAKLVGL